MKNKEFLEGLLNALSPSGMEKEATKVWDSYMSEFTDKYYTDRIGNSAYSLGSGEKIILVSAHIDEICMGVQNIKDDGTLNIINLAGVDRKCLPGAQVVIINEAGGHIPGIIQKSPIHIECRDNLDDKVLGFEDVVVDIGASDKKEAEKLVEIGNLVVFSRNVNLNFGQNKLYGNALDDKIGVYIVSQVAEALSTETLPKDYKVVFLAGTQEESGLRGLTVAAKNINPDISIDIDVTFANENIAKYGNIELGKGPVIEYGQDKSRRIAGIMTNVATVSKIEIQKSMSRCGGTNTNTIQLSSKDCETMLISIPNRSMHTPNETCDWRDVSGAIDLISKTILSGRL